MFNNIYRDKKVLVTGNTGFKGSWLTSWLIQLGSKIIGVSNSIPTNPSLFKEMDLESKITNYTVDVRDLDQVSKIIEHEKPDFIFHLAAQPIVSISYLDPINTISTNVLGTTNILEALRRTNHTCSAIIITSDKVYDNIEQSLGYKEDSTIGGKDIYSGSKGAAELIIKSYFYSFFNKQESNVKLAIGRAGNSIGGGDWARDRIVADCMLAWSKKMAVDIRCPNSTRPWQHVLEPLSGYLLLGEKLYTNNNFNGESFNFGPSTEQNFTVKKLLWDLSDYWNITEKNKAFNIVDNIPFNEATLLKLNCHKALLDLKWKATLNYNETIQFTSLWYYNYYIKKSNVFDYTMNQIIEYEKIAMERNIKWAR